MLPPVELAEDIGRSMGCNRATSTAPDHSKDLLGLWRQVGLQIRRLRIVLHLHHLVDPSSRRCFLAALLATGQDSEREENRRVPWFRAGKTVVVRKTKERKKRVTRKRTQGRARTENDRRATDCRVCARRMRGRAKVNKSMFSKEAAPRAVYVDMMDLTTLSPLFHVSRR